MTHEPFLPDLTSYIRPGDTVAWGQSGSEPLTLIRALVAQRHTFGRIRLFLGIGQSGELRAEHADAFDFLSYCGSGANRKLAQAGLLDILPNHYSQLPDLLRCDGLRVDVVMIQVSPADSLGRHSLGLSRDYLPAALENARVVIVEVNDRIPWTYGGPYLHSGDVDLLVSSNSETSLVTPAAPGLIEQAIGSNVAAFVRDGSTLQTGIGTIPDAVLAALADRRDLGVHSGSLGNGIAALCDAGVITNGRKCIDRGISIGGILIGGEFLSRYAHQNPSLELRGAEYTHNPRILAKINDFVAINSAIEVDLTGQINTEVAGGVYLGAIGGALDFLRAAHQSSGGVPIIALPSTAGPHSRIVSALSGPVSIPRSDAGVIVTEYGAADLRGLSLSSRRKCMIAIAHPKYRESLKFESRAAFD